MLQGAVERSKGGASWTDVLLAIKRAKELKVKASLDSLFSDFSLESLMQAEKLADSEVFKTFPTAKQAAPAPASQPPVVQSKAGKSKKG